MAGKKYRSVHINENEWTYVIGKDPFNHGEVRIYSPQKVMTRVKIKDLELKEGIKPSIIKSYIENNLI